MRRCLVCWSRWPSGHQTPRPSPASHVSNTSRPTQLQKQNTVTHDAGTAKRRTERHLQSASVERWTHSRVSTVSERGRRRTKMVWMQRDVVGSWPAHWYGLHTAHTRQDRPWKTAFPVYHRTHIRRRWYRCFPLSNDPTQFAANFEFTKAAFLKLTELLFFSPPLVLGERLPPPQKTMSTTRGIWNT